MLKKLNVLFLLHIHAVLLKCSFFGMRDIVIAHILFCPTFIYSKRIIMSKQ